MISPGCDLNLCTSLVTLAFCATRRSLAVQPLVSLASKLIHRQDTAAADDCRNGTMGPCNGDVRHRNSSQPKLEMCIKSFSVF